METWMISLVANAVLALIAYAMKSTIDDLKEVARNNKQDIEHIKDKYIRKEDFQDFKKDLWDRLDRFESDIKVQVRKDG
jgi:hypothetical protein